MRDKSTPLLDATNDRLNTDARCDPNETIGDVPLMGNSFVGQTWYPNQSMGYCISDGKELENFVKPSQIFVSALHYHLPYFTHSLTFSHCRATFTLFVSNAYKRFLHQPAV